MVKNDCGGDGGGDGVSCTSAAVRDCASRGGAGYIGDWIARLGIWRLPPAR